MTKMGRKYHRRVLLYSGNKRGLVCYGVGRGLDYRSAYTNAFKELKKNLIAIPLNYDYTLTGTLQHRFNDYRLKITPMHFSKVWGNPVMILMLRYAGLNQMKFSIISRKKDPYAMVFCFFKNIVNCKTPEQLAEASGKRANKISYMKPRRYSPPCSNFIHNKTL
jgi:ribosomal protein S5